VTGREPSPAELEQHRTAAVSHGAYRGRITRFAWGPLYESLKEAFQRAVDRPTTLRERDILQEVAQRLDQIDSVQSRRARSFYT
jgi:hypothetical protein